VYFRKPFSPFPAYNLLYNNAAFCNHHFVVNDSLGDVNQPSLLSPRFCCILTSTLIGHARKSGMLLLLHPLCKFAMQCL
jgi:hypothetical protein